MRSSISIVQQMADECQRLNSFAETHLVSQYTIHLAGVQHCQPVETDQLVTLQGESGRSWEFGYLMDRDSFPTYIKLNPHSKNCVSFLWLVKVKVK